MSDAKATDKNDQPLQAIEKQALKSPDAHAVQNANAQQFLAALKANLDKHSGSAGGESPDSIQIHMGDGRIASRLSAVTENQLLEPESIKNARSISLNELVEKQEKDKDPIARSLVGEFEQLLAMRKGPAKEAFEKRLQDKADQTYGRGQYALHELPASQAVEPMPSILDSLKQPPHDSDTKLNIQVTPVPELSKALNGEDALKYFQQTTQAAADASRESAMQVIEHYAHPDVVNGDLVKAGSALYNLDFLKVADFAVQTAAKIGEQLDKPLTQEQRAKMTGSMLLFFSMDGKPLDSEAAKAMNLEKLTDEELNVLGIERKIEKAAEPIGKDVLTSEQKEIFRDPEKDLMPTGLQLATPELLNGMQRKGRVVDFARHGTDELRYLDAIGCDGNAGGPNFTHILLRENPSKIAALEEFLHGTQSKLGLFDSKNMPRLVGEVRVKDFMLRHQTLLGLTDNEALVLKALKQNEIEKALRAGHTDFEIEVKRWGSYSK